jgi:hypothetical protein
MDRPFSPLPSDRENDGAMQRNQHTLRLHLS